MLVVSGDSQATPRIIIVAQQKIISMYQELRQRAITTKHKELNLDLSDDRTQAYGVLIDIAVEDGSATIVAFRTGDASMYTSSGGGIIGGIGHETVRNASIKLVEAANKKIAELATTDSMQIPEPGNVRYYVLTNNGRYFADETEDEFFSRSGRLSDLSAAGNDLIAELRVIDESR